MATAPAAASNEGSAAVMPDAAFADAVHRLTGEFPEVSARLVTSLLADGCRVVEEAAGQPAIDKAEELTRLRLEIRAGRPARRGLDAAVP